MQYIAMEINTIERVAQYDNFEYPAVTVCNLNPVRKSAIQSQPGLINLTKYLNSDIKISSAADFSKKREQFRQDFFATKVCRLKVIDTEN
jgi:hypothetical protein